MKNYKKTISSLTVWISLAGISFMADHLTNLSFHLPSGLSILELTGLLASILAASELLCLLTQWILHRKNKPAVEGVMIGRLYRLTAVLIVILSIAFGFGKLATFGTFFSLFGGMLLGWSLQAPVSGFAAWILVSLKRPFRPGDRIQLPGSHGLTGDVHEIGPMYTVLNQVGGSISSEEAVGRYVLVPNAMLFSQIVINYTVEQEAAYILDEVVIRITHNSDWSKAEKILLEAANDVTEEIIETTGVLPYIRSDLYDYGVYLRLRYQTRVRNRAEIAYEITKRIFSGFQQDDSVDFAIPYVYSYRSAMSARESNHNGQNGGEQIQQIPIEQICSPDSLPDARDLEQMVASISIRGLLQPIIVVKNPLTGTYDLLAGHLRLEACRHLNWTKIPAIIQKIGVQETHHTNEANFELISK